MDFESFIISTDQINGTQFNGNEITLFYRKEKNQNENDNGHKLSMEIEHAYKSECITPNYFHAHLTKAQTHYLQDVVLFVYK